jgi:hypothetical protein
VATVDRTGNVEHWLGDPFSKKLFHLVLGQTDRRLRTTNAQRAHRHIVIDSEREFLFSDLRQLCQRYGFRPRSRKRARQLNSRHHQAHMRRIGC